MSVNLEVTHRNETYKLNLDPLTTVGDLRKLMYNYTNVLPEKQKFMGWAKFNDNTLLAECVKKKDKVTMMGSPSKTANPNMITSAPGGFEFTTAADLRENLEKVLEDRTKVDQEAVNGWFKVMKAQLQKDKKFLNEPGLLRLVLLSAVAVPKLFPDVLKMLGQASPSATYESIPELVELTASLTDSTHVKFCVSFITTVAAQRAKRFTQENVDTLIHVAQEFPEVTTFWMMAFNRLAQGNPAPFAKTAHIDYFFKQMAGTDRHTHLPALVLSHVAKNIRPPYLEKKLDEVCEIILDATNDILKFMHGPMLLAAIVTGPSFSANQRESIVDLIVTKILEDPDMPKQYITVVLMQIFVIANHDRQILTKYKDVFSKYETSNPFGKGMLDIINGNNSSEATQLMKELEKQIANLEQKVEDVASANAENSQNINMLSGRVDDVETRVDEQDNKIVDLTDDVAETKEHVADLTEVVSDHQEQITTVQDQVNDHEEKLEKVAQVIIDVEYLKNYVDKNMEDMKEFIGKVVKKLPMPIRFSAEGTIIRTLKLHFACSRMDADCMFNMNNTFTTETKDWNKWLKLGVSGVSLAQKIYNKDIMATITEIKNAYSILQSTEDSDFATYMQEPLLTSDEQDKLINQLRDAKFFDSFQYDAQLGGWSCPSCLNKAAMKRQASNAQLTSTANNNNNNNTNTNSSSSSSPAPTSPSSPTDNKPNNKFLSIRQSHSTIWEAASGGEVARLVELLKFGTDVNSADVNGQTPLHHAVKNEQIPIIEVLLEKGANVNAIDQTSVCAIDCGKPEIRELILEKLSFPPMFVPDSTYQNCQLCGINFTQTRRRHHCRHCGKLVCKECSKFKAKLPSFGFGEPQRVCTICIAVISRVKKEALPPTVQLQKQMDEQQAQGKSGKGIATAVTSGRTAAKLLANKLMK
mmetsp:Transcript_11330/g.15704  ORF Transcript_11330/g.15704 Transcript_11330/m.15704 type:complete len:923 (-) Transcript_11330:19-2787(-)